MKLLEKSAEGRYQSAWGINADLQNCHTQLQTTGEIKSFALGVQGICDRLQISQKLYGREAEIQALLSAYDRVSQNRSEIELIFGSAGVGKTAIVQEIRRQSPYQCSYFITGRFDQLQRDTSFKRSKN